jgi:hypothetical protein
VGGLDVKRTSNGKRSEGLIVIVIVGLAYCVTVVPQIKQGEKRAQLCLHWNEINEQNEDGATFYSPSGIFDQTLVVHLAPQAGTIDQDEFLDELESGDATSGELRNLGFSRIKCGNRTIRLQEASDNPATGDRQLDFETAS